MRVYLRRYYGTTQNTHVNLQNQRNVVLLIDPMIN